MSYILDSNSLFELPRDGGRRDDLAVITEVYEEYALTELRRNHIRRLGIKVLQPQLRHFQKLKEVILTHGTNLDLISLRKNKGTADVLILAYILSERDAPETLFPNDYILITKDATLAEVADAFDIKHLGELP